MRYDEEEFLNIQIEFQKKKMYLLSEEYGISSEEVLEQSLVVDALINQFMRFGTNLAKGHPLKTLSSSFTRLEA
ncbi:MAG TPA: aspartyl-phosphate phosphatase Spo0E family protein [Firmicutes bacterium]|jgi:hypothetical protein|nr:aspartyl-phosphate phosphatase Spo0E family protein [Bacillota bacterium]